MRSNVIKWGGMRRRGWSTKCFVALVLLFWIAESLAKAAILDHANAPALEAVDGSGNAQPGTEGNHARSAALAVEIRVTVGIGVTVTMIIAGASKRAITATSGGPGPNQRQDYARFRPRLVVSR